ncbi:MAG: hypothetical protein RIE08_09270 [Acidimicrobiales bacterium]
MSTVPRIPVADHPRAAMFEQNRELGRRFRTLYATFWREGVLDQEVKEIVRMRNARMVDCGW